MPWYLTNIALPHSIAANEGLPDSSGNTHATAWDCNEWPEQVLNSITAALSPT